MYSRYYPDLIRGFQPDPPGLNATTLASSPPGRGRPHFRGVSVI